MTKFFLYILLCSAVTMECNITSTVPLEYDNYYNCMKDGYGISFEMLFSETKSEVVEEQMLFTKWLCKEEYVNLT